MKKKRTPLWLLGIFFLFPAFTFAGLPAESLDRWQEKSPFSGGAPSRISCGEGIFVAVGDGGSIYTSSDGEVWKEQNSGTEQPLRDAACADGVIVAVGAGGTILSSSDGLIWTGRDSGTGYDLHGVTHGRGVFVAVGDGGIILISQDGLAWMRGDSGIHDGLNKVAFGRDTFVAIGRNGTLLASPDGVVWSRQSSGTHAHLEGIVHGKDTFVAVGETILTSPDGRVWTEETAGTGLRLLGIAYGGGVFAAAGDSGVILISSDGSRWTAKDTGTRRTLWAVAHGKGMFLAAGEGGTLLRSDMAPSAQISVSPSSLDFGSVAVGSSSFTNLTVSNSGSADLIIRQITFSGTNSQDFNARNDACTGKALTPSQNCTVQVSFAPHSSGSKSATLSISSNDPVTPNQTVSLSGNGTGGDNSFIFVSGGSGSFCFISSSVKGTGLEDYLGVLRKFRDAVLSKSRWGRKLVYFYYRHSPAINQLFAGHDLLRQAVMFGLVPPLAAFAHVALHTSFAEKAILLLLLAVATSAGRRLIRRPGKNRTALFNVWGHAIPVFLRDHRGS